MSGFSLVDDTIASALPIENKHELLKRQNNQTYFFPKALYRLRFASVIRLSEQSVIK